jgi:hypothetical protein
MVLIIRANTILLPSHLILEIEYATNGAANNCPATEKKEITVVFQTYLKYGIDVTASM